MSLFKKTMFALAAASLFIFAGCSSSDDLNVKVAEIEATIEGFLLIIKLLQRFPVKLQKVDRIQRFLIFFLQMVH